MKKFAVFSGFLGSGKTTAMMALTRYHSAQHGKAAMISNDLGDMSLADHKLAVLAGCNASELTGECICFQTENLVARLDALFDADGCELVISDIPGFGVGAPDHVYHTLQTRYPGRYALAPFTVLTEPRTAALLRDGQGGDLAHILRAQLQEADLIVLNKCDLLSEEEQARELSYLRQRFPRAQVLGISALTGQGLEQLSQALTQGCASTQLPDIDYDSPDLDRAMSRLSEYYLQYYAVVCCNVFDGDAYLMALARAVQDGVRDLGCEIPHLKLLAWEPEGAYAKVDLLGAERPIEVAARLNRPCTELAVMLNGSAVCPDAALDRIITGAAETVSEQYNLAMTVYKKECFGMGD